MDFAADLPLMLDEFAVCGTLAGAPVHGIFDQAYDVSGLGTIGMASTGPAFTLPSAQVPAQAYGALLVVPAGRYSVREAQHDGTGVCVLQLERAA
jgi:hypothetical protein